MVSRTAALLLAFIWPGIGGARPDTERSTPWLPERNDGTSSGQTPLIIGHELVEGHADFGDGRRRTVSSALTEPACEGCYWTNVMLGNGGCVLCRLIVGAGRAEAHAGKVLISVAVSCSYACSGGVHHVDQKE